MGPGKKPQGIRPVCPVCIATGRCADCDGRGHAEGDAAVPAAAVTRPCPLCQGTGRCVFCKGTGKLVSPA